MISNRSRAHVTHLRLLGKGLSDILLSLGILQAKRNVHDESEKGSVAEGGLGLGRGEGLDEAGNAGVALLEVEQSAQGSTPRLGMTRLTFRTVRREMVRTAFLSEGFIGTEPSSRA